MAIILYLLYFTYEFPFYTPNGIFSKENVFLCLSLLIEEKKAAVIFEEVDVCYYIERSEYYEKNKVYYM